jgi:hypothetical protein
LLLRDQILEKERKGCGREESKLLRWGGKGGCERKINERIRFEVKYAFYTLVG